MFKKVKAFSLAAFGALALLGCKEVKIENGQLPAEYVPTARAHEGVYSGNFDGRAARIELRLDDRRPVLTFADDRGSDLLHPECRSRIGDLKTVTVDQQGSAVRLNSAVFAFDPGGCFMNLDGRELRLTFSRRGNRDVIDASVLRAVRYDRRCSWEGGDPTRGIPPVERCYWDPIYQYFNGRFAR